MAVTYAVTVEDGVKPLGGEGNDYYAFVTLTATGTYTTGGDAVTVTGLQNIRRLSVSNAAGRLLDWDEANQKLLVKAWATAGATVAASEITAGTTTTGEVYKGVAYGQ
jgi:hypothetical protein